MYFFKKLWQKSHVVSSTRGKWRGYAISRRYHNARFVLFCVEIPIKKQKNGRKSRAWFIERRQDGKLFQKMAYGCVI
jgi:hypothetical protein